MSNILYFGDCFEGSTSGHRARAIKRSSHTVEFRDPYKAFENSLTSRWLSVLHYRTGYALLQKKMVKWLEHVMANLERKPDFIWVDHGELFGPECVKTIKKANCPVVLYNVDDPTGK